MELFTSTSLLDPCRLAREVKKITKLCGLIAVDLLHPWHKATGVEQKPGGAKPIARDLLHPRHKAVGVVEWPGYFFEPRDPVLDILSEDGPLLAVNKPAGLLTQGPPGVPSLERVVKEWLKEKHGKPGNVYLGIPHRLDRPVSGVVVFARNSKAAARLAEQFSERRVKKIYRAVVEGSVREDEGTLIDRLRKLPDEARATVADASDPAAREAVLSYRVLERIEVAERALPATIVEIDPATGRMHQIRVQFASRGFPVVGDARYGARSRWSAAHQTWTWDAAGDSAPGRDAADCFDERIALHARRLTLFHPIRYDELVLEAPFPEAWERLGRQAVARSPGDGSIAL